MSQNLKDLSVAELQIKDRELHESLFTVTEKFVPYAEKVSEELAKHGIRVKVDARNEKIGYKLRQGRNERVSYLAVDREEEGKSLSLRIYIEGH